MKNELKLIARWVRWEESGSATVSEGMQPMMQAAAGRATSSHGEDVNALIAEVIKDQVRRVAGERANVLQLDTNIVLDLGLDSLERLEIARNLEQTFGGRFPEQVLDEIETFDYGKFVHILDPEGNKLELWEPIDDAFDDHVGGRTK